MAKVTIRGGRRLAAFARELRAQQPVAAQAGVFGGTYPKGTPMPLVAAVNEFGSPSQGIPERPAFRAAIQQLRGEVPRMARDAVRSGGGEPPGQGDVLEAADRGAELIQESMKAWTQPPNAPATIRKKGRDDPWIDTRRMVNAIEAKAV